MATSKSSWFGRLLLSACVGTALLLGVRPSYGQGCTPIIPDHENPGQFFGCCDLNGNALAANAACIMPGTPCKMGTCQGGSCVLAVGVNRPGNPLCRHQNDPCLVGDCTGGDCTAPFHLTGECTAGADGSVCTDDCRPNNATTADIFDVLCGPFPIPGPCSVLNGSNCRPGTCNTTSGQCDPDMTKPQVSCSTANDCKIATCQGINANGNPICDTSTNAEIGKPCDTNVADNPDACNPNDPDFATTPRYLCNSDCKRRACDGEGQCRTIKADYDNWSCEKTGGECTKGVCDDGSCNFEFNLPNESPCSSDNNVCSRDLCFGGVCDHSLQPAGMEGQPCTDTSGCQASGSGAAICAGTTCDIQTCDTTKNCMNCASVPCTANAATECGCGG